MGGVLKFLVVFLVVGVAIWFWVARSRIGRTGRDKQAPSANAGSDRAVASPAEMVACAHCGLHLPAADALEAGGRHYCSAAHRLLGPAAQ